MEPIYVCPKFSVRGYLPCPPNYDQGQLNFVSVYVYF